MAESEAQLSPEVHAGIATAALTAAAAMQHANQYGGVPYAPSYNLSGPSELAAPPQQRYARSPASAAAEQAMYLLQPPHVLQQLAEARRFQAASGLAQRPPAVLAPLNHPMASAPAPHPEQQPQVAPTLQQQPLLSQPLPPQQLLVQQQQLLLQQQLEQQQQQQQQQQLLLQPQPPLWQGPEPELGQQLETAGALAYPHGGPETEQMQAGAPYSPVEEMAAPAHSLSDVPATTAAASFTGEAGTMPPSTETVDLDAGSPSAVPFAPTAAFPPANAHTGQSSLDVASVPIGGLTDAKALALRLAEAEAEISALRVEVAIANEKAESFKALAAAKDEIIAAARKQTTEWRKYASEVLVKVGPPPGAAGKDDKKDKDKKSKK